MFESSKHPLAMNDDTPTVNMSDSDDFDTTSLYVPFEGMYLTFSFDVQETLDFHCCDPEDYAHLSEEIKNFPNLRYVGVLVDVCILLLLFSLIIYMRKVCRSSFTSAKISDSFHSTPPERTEHPHSSV